MNSKVEQEPLTMTICVCVVVYIYTFYVYNTEVALHVCEHVCMCMYVIIMWYYRTHGEQVSNGVWYMYSCTTGTCVLHLLYSCKSKRNANNCTHTCTRKMWSTLSVVNVPRQPTRNNNPYKPTLNQTLSLVFHRRSWYRTLL